ncbi:hypothetical protein JDV02_007410 [Purpureocillium takamizusanense]|uniref:Uncharacterized protein n=1 Tax=Purpureocillium takamizusanense TaxID=2060973 RepID=A0A9Q8QK73_9HYPO|nr:uncharacterized protein JDV02_007410 [Purpureocillium takamizusanense]UNI21418.1 hypothetical protein JDV02_007410 [Purpureocillium takamizusanense]
MRAGHCSSLSLSLSLSGPSGRELPSTEAHHHTLPLPAPPYAHASATPRPRMAHASRSSVLTASLCDAISPSASLLRSLSPLLAKQAAHLEGGVNREARR